MFGMNPEDAQRALEDASIYRDTRAAAHSREQAAQDRSVKGSLERGTMALKERESTINRLTRDLWAAGLDRNLYMADVRALGETFKHVIRDFAKSAGVSEEELLKRYNTVRSQHFNRIVDQWVDEGHFGEQDPRVTLPAEQQEWYVSGLDADRGF